MRVFRQDFVLDLSRYAYWEALPLVRACEALCRSQTLATGTGKQAPNSDRHIAKHRAERRRIITLAGQHASTRRTQAMTLAHHGYLRRNHLGLERRCDLLCLGQPQSKVGHAGLFIALEAANLHLRRHPNPQLHHQLHATPASPPAHLLPVSPRLTQPATDPQRFACSLSGYGSKNERLGYFLPHRDIELLQKRNCSWEKGGA